MNWHVDWNENEMKIFKYLPFFCRTWYTLQSLWRRPEKRSDYEKTKVISKFLHVAIPRVWISESCGIGRWYWRHLGKGDIKNIRSHDDKQQDTELQELKTLTGRKAGGGWSVLDYNYKHKPKKSSTGDHRPLLPLICRDTALTRQLLIINHWHKQSFCFTQIYNY